MLTSSDTGAREPDFADASGDVIVEMMTGAGFELADRKLLSDEEMAADARDMVANAKKAFGGIEAVTSDIKAGKGTLGRLASDEQLADNVDQAIKGFKKTGQNLGDITDKVKKGEGTVGKLISDDKLINTAQSILDSVQAALEDLRESAPVASFAGAILGAF